MTRVAVSSPGEEVAVCFPRVPPKGLCSLANVPRSNHQDSDFVKTQKANPSLREAHQADVLKGTSLQSSHSATAATRTEHWSTDDQQICPTWVGQEGRPNTITRLWRAHGI